MGSLKVGDKAIVVSCNPDANKYKHKVGTIIEIDQNGFIRKNFIFPYRIKVESGDMFWCRAVPCSSLIEELF
jgi:hypothetical protein